jgi:hypothetical protein
MMSQPRRSVLSGTTLLGLTLVVLAASASPARADSRAYQAWRSANASSFKIPGGSAGTIAAAKPAADAGGQVVTTSADDTDNDGTVDQRSIVTTNFDKQGRIVRVAQEYDFDADGTVEASTVTTTEYDKSGNAIRQVSVSNINDLGSGGDGSVYETTTATTTDDAKDHPVLQVVELDQESDGTLELRQATTYVNDASGNVLQTVLETDQGADGSVDSRFTTSATYDKQGNQLEGGWSRTSTPTASWSPAQSRGRRTTPTATWSRARRSSTTEPTAASTEPVASPPPMTRTAICWPVCLKSTTTAMAR